MGRDGANLLRGDTRVQAPGGEGPARQATGLQEHLLSEGASSGRDRKWVWLQGALSVGDSPEQHAGKLGGHLPSPGKAPQEETRGVRGGC